MKEMTTHELSAKFAVALEDLDAAKFCRVALSGGTAKYILLNLSIN